MSRLVDRANQFIFNCLAASTRMTYASALNSYLNCYSEFGHVAPFPATEVSLVIWLTHCATRAQRPLASSTMRTYLSGLVSLHEEMGFRGLLEDKPLVSRCFKGIKKSRAVNQLDRRPITTDIIAQLRTQLNPSSFHCRLYYAAATLATFGLLRMGEFTVDNRATSKSNAFKVLTLQQLKLMKEDGTVVPVCSFADFTHVTRFSLTLRTSKTDPFRKSVTIHVGHSTPVHAMLDYLRVHPRINDMSAPLFVQSKTNHQPLTRSLMIGVTRILLQRLGFNESHYHGHSFRKGGATSLFQAGVADSVIQLMGRWTSDCYKLYIVTPISTLLQASRSLS